MKALQPSDERGYPNKHHRLQSTALRFDTLDGVMAYRGFARWGAKTTHARYGTSLALP
jgi:hypothetical protein